MKRNRWFLRMLVMVLVSGLLSVTVSVAANAGTEDDPLVTLSYLNETFLNTILEKVDEKIAQRNQQIVQELGGQISAGDGSATSTNFTVVTLSYGQILTGDIGCEVMLRVGKAVCVSPSNPGLIDETSGNSIGNGAELVQNHLYMMTIEGRGVQAVADTVKVLVRGSYTIA